MKTQWLLGLMVFFSVVNLAQAQNKDLLIKFKNTDETSLKNFTLKWGGSLEEVSKVGNVYRWLTDKNTNLATADDDSIVAIQGNHPIHLFANPSIVENQKAIYQALSNRMYPQGNAYPDNPVIQKPQTQPSGSDPLLSKCWGIMDIGADLAWNRTPKGQGLIVAVTDTGMDYNHPDLINAVWWNKNEIADNGVDDDKNGYIDDVIGWDFYANDNKPYDLSLDLQDILLNGGNPGHGTHVSGVVGARLNNGQGVAGVAPEVRIMPLRFISEKGQGDTAGAVKAIDYAVAMGAKVINASWGSEGEEEGDVVLREAIQRAMAKGVLFVAAAGNGRLNQSTQKQEGYDNDTDSKPSYPAAYPYENIIAVAAINSSQQLAEFSNYGKNTVKLGAPGVKIMSTVPGGNYQDTIVDLGFMQVTWDGTSMASPFVTGSVAEIWSTMPGASWQQVKQTLLANTTALSSLSGKTSTGGKLDLHQIH